MLKTLKISNFALIQDQILSFDKGLNIISGETGSGKSMILDALSIVFGNRWHPKLFYFPQKKCILEAKYELSTQGLKPFFEENDLDFDFEIIVRREALPSGRNRMFINDTPVNINVLKQLGEQLLSVHSQHQNLDLSNVSFQMNLLDSFIVDQNTQDFVKLKELYKTSYLEYLNKKQLLSEFETQFKTQQLEKDYQNFLFDELKSLPLDSINEKELEEKVTLIENQDKIKGIINEITLGSDNGMSPASSLERWNVQCNELSTFSPKFKEWSNRIYDLLTELNDLTYEIESFELGDESYSIKELDEINSLLFELEKLKRKHNVSTVNELLEIQNNLSLQNSESEFLEENIEKIKVEISKLTEELTNIGLEIHQFRLKFAPELSLKIEKLLSELAMPNAKLIFDLHQINEFNENGVSKIDLLFSANKGFEPKPIKHTASGGEFARLSLVLQSILNVHNDGSVVVLDEIDTGVSGEVAHKMGLMMQQMSNNNPVLCISHLAQVVSKGDKHFKVSKNNNTEKTSINIKELSYNERVKEVASLLSGENILDSSLSTAKQLLAN